MRLKNKKTGETAEVEINYNSMLVTYEDGRIEQYYFDSLKDLEEWEDYEEPKGIQCIYYVNHFDAAKIDGVIIGFNTKEEAKQALEKLKAWKRLKDKEFRFTNWEFTDVLDGVLVIEAGLNFDNDSNIQRDLEICFGGEE